MNETSTPLISIVDLHEWTCRYPIGDPQDWDAFGYCGAPIVELDKPYCESHCSICYVQREERSR